MLNTTSDIHLSDHFLPYNRIATASLSNGLFFVAQTIVFLAITPLALYALGKDVYGLWIIMLAVLGFSNLAQFGTDIAIAKFTAQYSASGDMKDKFSAVVTFSHVFLFITGMLFSVLLWYLRYWIARRFDANANFGEHLPSVFGLMACGIIPGFLFSASRGVLLGLVRNNLTNSFDLGSNILLWVGAAIIGLMEGGILFLSLWIVTINVLRFFLCGYVTIRVTAKYNLRFVLDMGTIKELLRFSFFSWISTLGGTMLQTLDRLLVGMVLGPSASGVYGIAVSVGSRLSGLASRIVQTLLPFSSSQEEVGSRQKIISVLRYSTHLVGCGSLLISGILVIWMDEILLFWISAEFAQAYSLLFRLTVVFYGIYSFTLPSEQIAQGMGWLVLPACVYLVAGLTMNLLIWFLAPSFGINGAIAANSVLIFLIVINFYLTRKLGLSFSNLFKDLGIFLFLFIIMMIIPFLVISLSIKFLITFVLIGITCQLVFGHGRLKTLLKVIKGT